MSDMDYEVAHGIAQIENAKLRAEVERLRAALQDALIGINQCCALQGGQLASPRHRPHGGARADWRRAVL